ncbi:hypothetical protein Bca52824_004565 [Brassica carinata]|uniref:Uncharacterized protein n=1 Tax=Brassica carinata TaxID=52824 RepID=A0A8X8BFT4_BRACI|nr:hypothetical protein Bca52824_004565 [Brassica carinata]
MSLESSTALDTGRFRSLLVRPTSLSGPRIEAPSTFISLDAGEASARRRRVLCSAFCSSLFRARSTGSPFNVFRFCGSLGDGSNSRPSLTVRRRALCSRFGVWATRSVTFWGTPLFFAMPVSFNHHQTSRSMPFRQGLPSCPPSLSQLGLGCGSLIPGVNRTPLVSRASVPVSRYLLKTSSSRTIPIASSSTNSKFDGLLRDSEKIRFATPLLCLAEGPICSGGPNSPYYVGHRLSFNDRLSISAGCSFPGACLTFFSLYTIKRSTWTGPRVVPNWAWTSTLPDIVVSPQTRNWSAPMLLRSELVKSTWDGEKLKVREVLGRANSIVLLLGTLLNFVL